VRSVRSPEFDGVTFHEVHARSVLNKVPAGSGVPFGWTVNPYRGCSHACTYCLEGGTRILMADGRTKALSDLKVGDEIYGTRGHGASRRLVPTRVEAHWTTLRAAYRVTLEDGTRLVAGGDHRFLTSKGWKHVTGSKFGAAQRPHLEPGTELIGVGRFEPTPDETLGYRAGYLCGMLRSGGFAAEPDAAARALRYLPDFGASVGFLKVPPDPDAHWQRGFLAGVFDLAGDYGRGVLAVAHDEPEIADAFTAALDRFGFAHQLDEVPKFPTRQEIRVLGGVGEVLRFFHVGNPAVAWKRSLEGAVIGASRRRVEAIEPLGLQLPLFDITTGTGDFVADGMVSHNCFARNTHTYLDFDAGRDFDTQVVVKINAPQVLAAQLKKPSWRREHVAMGTNTDPYQRAVGRYRLMPAVIRALARSGTPFSVLTKGTVLTRDLPELTAAAADVPVRLGVSIALVDRELQGRLEPGTPTPTARLELVRRITDAGLPCGVMVAPVLPLLTDSAEALDALLLRIAAAGATGATVLALHLRPGTREWFLAWLAREHPRLVEPYGRLYRRGAYVDPEYRRSLGRRVAPLLRRHGLLDPTPALREPEPAEEPSDGTAGGGPGPGVEQLSLL
jgi:DNA repair photolyase